MARKNRSTKTELRADQRLDLAEYMGKALVAATAQLRITANAEPLPLNEDERATVAVLPALASEIKRKLIAASDFTVGEVATIVLTVVPSFADAEPKQRIVLLRVAKKLTDRLQAKVVKAAKKVSPSDPRVKGIEFSFQHPASAEAGFIFHSLCRKIRSDADYRALPRRDRFLWDVTLFESEVMNGGVDQFMYNSAGDHTTECLEALEAIKANQSVDMLKQACALFPNGHPSADRGIRQKQLLAICGNDPYIGDVISGQIEVNLYQLLLDYYHKTDSKEK